MYDHPQKLSYLKKDSEEDDSNGGSDKELLADDVIGKSKDQGERNCTSQTTVGQTKLIFHVKRNGAKRVNDLSHHQNTWEERAEKCHNVIFSDSVSLTSLNLS